MCSVRIKRAGSANVVNGLRFEGPFIIPGTRAWPSEKLFVRPNRRGQGDDGSSRVGKSRAKAWPCARVGERKKRTQLGDEKGPEH